MTSRLPLLETTLAGVAVGSLATLFFLPPSHLLAPELHPWAVGLSAGWSLWRLAALARALERQRRWVVSPDWCLEVARLPRGHGLLLGKGFRWNAIHVQQLETAMVEEGSLPTAETSRGGSPALHAVGMPEEQMVRLPETEMVGHMGILGTTRSGKTSLMKLLTVEAMGRDGALVVIDPKGEREWLALAKAEAVRQGRPFALLSPAFPQYSASMNVLGSAQTPLEVVDRIRALMPESKEPFFVEFSLAFIQELAHAQQVLGVPWTLEGLYEASVIRDHTEALMIDYLLHLDCYRPAAKTLTQTLQGLIAEYRKMGLRDHTADALINDYEWPRDHYQKITGTLIPTFSGVVGGPIGRLLSPLHPDLTWTRIVEDRMVVYCALASLLLGEVANRMGRTILQDLVGYLGQRYSYTDAAKATPITVLIDEFGDMAFPEFTNALNKGGGANARFALGMQSLADPEARMGREQARRLTDNLNTFASFRLTDMQTAQRITEGLTCTVELPESSAGIGYGGVGGLTGSKRTNLKQKEVPLISPAWLTGLPRGEAYCRIAGGWWKLRVPLLEPIAQTTLDALGLSAMWRAMDPNTVLEGELCDDHSVPTVPPTHWLPAPSLRALPSPDVTPVANASMKGNSSSFRRVRQAITRWWQRLGSRQV